MHRLRSGNEKSTVFVFYAVFFLIASITAWGILGYTILSGIISVWILIIISASFLVYAVSNVPRMKWFERLPYLCLILTIWLFILISRLYYPHAIQDEITIDTYSAYLLLHHVDPYIPANMVNVFSFYNFPISLTTPTTTGGYVDYLIYPALSVYLFVPSVLLGIPDYWIPIFFNIATFFVLIYYYRKRGFSNNIPALAILIFVEAELFENAATGSTDIIWLFFLVIAYIFRHKPWLSGLFFGLSLAQKQIPIVVAPFFLYFLFRENGKKYSSVYQSVFMAGITFILVNLQFILMNPGAWLTGMLLSVEQPAIGVGFGFGVLSFAGYAPIPSALFSDLLITALAMFFVIYVRYYGSLKYAFFAFPIIIFLFNFRSLENYVIYWPLLVMLVLPDYLGERDRKPEREPEKEPSRPARGKFLNETAGILHKSNFTIFLIIVIVVGGGLSAGYTISDNSVYKGQLKVNSVYNFSDPVMVDSSITSMSVNLSYSPLDHSQTKIPVYFRIIPKGSVSKNINSLLWSANDPYIKPGNNTLTIFPNLYSDFLHTGSNFTLEAYYGNVTSFYHTTTPLSITAGPLQNPYLQFPTYSNAEPFPGWNTTYSGNKGNMTYNAGGFSMNISGGSAQGSSWNSISMSSPIDFSSLAGGNYSLDYSILNTSGSTVNQTNSITRFAGVMLSFNGGQEKLWLGYNSSASSQRYYSQSRVNQTIISSGTAIHFAAIKKYLSSYGWGFTHARLSYVLETSANTTARMGLGNITYTRNNTEVSTFGTAYAGALTMPTQTNVYAYASASRPVTSVKPLEVVSW